jgi:hypothetical protein
MHGVSGKKLYIIATMILSICAVSGCSSLRKSKPVQVKVLEGSHFRPVFAGDVYQAQGGAEPVVLERDGAIVSHEWMKDFLNLEVQR